VTKKNGGAWFFISPQQKAYEEVFNQLRNKDNKEDADLLLRMCKKDRKKTGMTEIDCYTEELESVQLMKEDEDNTMQATLRRNMENRGAYNAVRQKIFEQDLKPHTGGRRRKSNKKRKTVHKRK